MSSTIPFRILNTRLLTKIRKYINLDNYYSVGLNSMIVD